MFVNWRAFGADILRARDEKRMTMKDLIELLDGAYTAWEHSEDSRTVGEHMKAALTRAGLAIVPVEPTEAMIAAGFGKGVCLAWQDMLRASGETE